MKVFAVYADYRCEVPTDDMHPYYVVADTKAEARQDFELTLSWLRIRKMYEVKDEALIADIKAHRTKYNCLGWYRL